jgi:hypothetical protein
VQLHVVTGEGLSQTDTRALQPKRHHGAFGPKMDGLPPLEQRGPDDLALNPQ